MFETVVTPPPDKILHLMRAFAEDRRPHKIDLGIGVYRNADGSTPVMRAVRTAEARVDANQLTKSYVALAGDPAFHAALRDLVLGDTVETGRIAALATPGGTGAVRQAFELIRRTRPGATVWVSDPTWPNHESILDTLGMRWRPYRHLDRRTGTLDRAGMMADLAGVAAGDVILLHGCCHNPSGVDLSPPDWLEIAALAQGRGAVPMIDLAYQGFGAGVDADVAGLRSLAAAVPEALVTVSGSKNFGMYRDRVGLLLAICATPAEVGPVQASLAWLNRQTYAFPPDHGARVVTEVLNDPALRGEWQAELDGMRRRTRAMRAALAGALRQETGSARFDFLEGQAGLFSLLGLTPDQVGALRTGHALYMIGDSRINLAGLTPDTVPATARAIGEVLR